MSPRHLSDRRDVLADDSLFTLRSDFSTRGFPVPPTPELRVDPSEAPYPPYDRSSSVAVVGFAADPESATGGVRGSESLPGHPVALDYPSPRWMAWRPFRIG